MSRYGRLEGTPADALDDVLRCLLDQEHVFTRLLADEAREQAAASTGRWRDGRPAGRLDGVPVAVKDCIDVVGVPTTNGSVANASSAPAARDATIVDALRASGAVLIGKTNLSELAFSGIGTNPHFGSPINPLSRDEPLITGGSSSGSAAAVASGYVDVALGTDTSGSVRVPAAFCGIVGYKASEGRFSRQGVRRLSPTLDSIGFLTPTAADLAYVVAALDPRTGSAGLQAAPRQARLVVPDDEVVADVAPEVAAWFCEAVEEVAGLEGVRVERRRLPVLAEAQELMDRHGTLVAAEAFTEYGRLLHASTEGLLDPAVARRLRVAAGVVSTIGPVGARMIELRQRVAVELDGALLLCPTVRDAPPAVSVVTASADAFDRWNARILRTTMLLSYLGMPGVSVPRGSGRRRGLGFLVSAPAGHDHDVIRAARLLDDMPKQTSPREQIGTVR
ncbi:amidase family protein [Nocardioides luteus]|uniref:amidase family protein n=1 Tax=Nocardioides luteus TaxID=1844 RepID=UPI0018CBA45B|nr:amidase family protein [Nocardioides luteus]MBG6095834.1 aspartyl-tRNA(Asn)/glutamyl-tRNA(Gln) amidotransferase subunit A [Nocardioides luteus]